jgi:hypothetical protein
VRVCANVCMRVRTHAHTHRRRLNAGEDPELGFGKVRDVFDACVTDCASCAVDGVVDHDDQPEQSRARAAHGTR